MNIIESVEYYSTCPQCGAANNGKEECEYCGASLIKKRVNQSIGAYNISQEEANAMEDYGIPVIHGKLREKDTFLILFSVIFGGCFMIVPIIVGIAFISTGIMEGWVLAMLSLFLLIGIGSFIPLIKYIADGIKCKTGESVSGVVRGYSDSMASINGRPVQNVRLLIDEDTEPKILEIGTGSTTKQFKPGTTLYFKRYKHSYIYDRNKMDVYW